MTADDAGAIEAHWGCATRRLRTEIESILRRRGHDVVRHGVIVEKHHRLTARYVHRVHGKRATFLSNDVVRGACHGR